MKILNQLLDLIYPRKCLLCRSISTTLLCDACQSKAFDYYGESKQLALDNYIGLFYYNDSLKQLIEELKYKKNQNLLAVFSKQIIKYAPIPERIDFIIPVPVNPLRFTQRGFNQTVELIRDYAKYYTLPIREDVVFRQANTQKMHLLDKDQRAKEVEAAFSVWEDKKEQLGGKNILIFDDIITTGATIRSIISTIQPFNPAKISILGLSRPLYEIIQKK